MFQYDIHVAQYAVNKKYITASGYVTI